MKYYKWQPTTPCPLNSGVNCPDQSQCSGCGWNPEVAEKRLEKVIEELKQKRREAANG